MGIDARMYVRTREVVSDQELRKRAYEMAEAFGADKFFIYRPGEGYGGHKETGRLALTRATEMNQDSSEEPEITPEKGEFFFQVHLMTRYWGPGYERGDLPFLLILAEWLERGFPLGEVHYGGDSSGVLLEWWGPQQRKEFLEHFCLQGNFPYRGDPRTVAGEDRMAAFRGHGDALSRSPHCDLCRVPMRRYGYGGGYGAYSCPGCDLSVSTNDGGATYKAKNKYAPDDESKATLWVPLDRRETQLDPAWKEPL